MISNLNPGFGSALNIEGARAVISGLTTQINKLTNQYLQESDVQKRKTKLEEMIEKVASMSNLLSCEPKSKTKALTDYLNELRKLLGLYEGPGYEFKYDWTKKSLPSSKFVTPEFLAKIVDVSHKLGIDPDDLLSVIAFETEYTFDPAFKTGNATGLIQFMPIIATDMGTTVDELAKMSAVEQLDYVYKYYNERKYLGELKTLSDIYMVTLWPAAVGKDENYVLYSQGSKYYEGNKSLDINKDGKVEKWEATQRVIDVRKAYEK